MKQNRHIERHNGRSGLVTTPLFEDFLDRIQADDLDDEREVSVDDEKPWQEYCFRLDFSFSVTRDDLFEQRYMDKVARKMWLIMEHCRFAEDWGLGMYGVYLIDGQEAEDIRDTKVVIVNSFHDIPDARERLCEQILTNGSEVSHLFCNVFVDIKPRICKFSEMTDDMMIIYKAMQRNHKDGAAVDIVRRTGPELEDVTPYTPGITNKKEFWAHEVCRELYVEMQKEAGADNPEKLDITKNDYSDRYSIVSYGYDFVKNMIWLSQNWNKPFAPLNVFALGYSETPDSGSASSEKFETTIRLLYQITTPDKRYANTDVILDFVKRRLARTVTNFDKQILSFTNTDYGKREFALEVDIYILTDADIINSEDSSRWYDEYMIDDVQYNVFFMVIGRNDKYLVVTKQGDIKTPEEAATSRNYLNKDTVWYMKDKLRMVSIKTYKPTHIRC